MRVATESTFGLLAAIFVGGAIAGAMLWRRDVLLARGAVTPPRRQPEPTPTPAPTPTPVAVPAPAPAPSGSVPVYTTATWLPYVQPLAEAAGVPTAYAQKWNEIEAAGQPCAVGGRFASFDGVHPRESGIAQLYGPDDYKTLGIDPAAFRAYCAPQYPDTYKGADGKQHQALAFSQQHVRALTPSEMNQQAAALISKIVISAHQADQLLVGRWDRGSRDYWAFVKLRGHGLPGLANAITYVAAYLGHFPGSWAEFRANVFQPDVLAKIKDDAKHGDETYAHLAEFAQALTNAENTASVVAPAVRQVV